MNQPLKIFTLGGVRILRAGDQPVDLKSRKAEALLVYLACNQRSIPREVLAEMFWDERSQSQSLSNLRYLLTILRKDLGDYLSIDRTSVAILAEADLWLDAVDFDEQLSSVLQQGSPITASAAEQLEQALNLFQGEFLEGFFVSDCRGFEEWLVRERERLHRLAVDGLHDLVDFDLQSGDYKSGASHAARLLELDPLMEAGHRQLMRILACSGQRAAALEQYEHCRELLKTELGLEPAPQTQALYEQIKSGALEDLLSTRPILETPAVTAPTFLKEETPERAQERPLFVARHPQITRLQAFLDQSLAGKSQLVFITGGPGTGKTALMDEFTHRAMDVYPDLLIVRGSCSAYTGMGDPFQPFRDVFAMLSGDVEARWSAGTISTAHARRIWAAVPLTIHALVEKSTDLVKVFNPGNGLLSRAAAALPEEQELLQKLKQLLDQASTETLEQSSLYESYARLLSELAFHNPLLILLDDLQWIDNASLNLLFHLGRRLASEKILVLGAYRPEEVALGRDGDPHPLEKLLAEFKVQYGDIWIDLNETNTVEGRLFVDELLDSEPNSLSEGFRSMLFRYTQGHALFTVEMLRNLQESGEILKDEQGKWVEKSFLDWNVLPTRVEGVIEERTHRLAPELRRLLDVACVEGEVFTLEVLASVCKINQRELVNQLSHQLAKRYRLIREEGAQTVGPLRLYLYRFNHILFQQHFYKALGELDRRLLHAEIAQALEELYGVQKDQIAPQLAHHWVQASEFEKAFSYLLSAGDQARTLYALEEAERFYQQAIDYLTDIGDTARLVQTWMKMGLVYTADFQPDKARKVYEKAFSLQEIAYQLESTRNQHPVGETLRYAIYEPFILDPALVYDSNSGFIISQLFEGLVCQDQQQNILPAIAKSWQVSDQGCRYIFHLREGCLWSDGIPLTASDFEYAWKRNMNPVTRSTFASLFYPILNAIAYIEGEVDSPEKVGVKALDDRTLEVLLEKPSAFLLHLLLHEVTYPLPRRTIERYGTYWTEPGNLVNNGAYTLSEKIPGVIYLLSRNPFYNGPFPGNVDRVECMIIEDENEIVEKYRADQVDTIFLTNCHDSAIERLVFESFKDDLYYSPQAFTTFLYFRVDISPMDQLLVRQAFSMAIDRTLLVRGAFDGRFLPATGGFVPPGIPGHSPGIGLPYDPQMARSLLARAGYPKGQDFPPVILSYLGLKEDKNAVPFLLASWQKHLGVKVETQLSDFKGIPDNLDQISAHMIKLGWLADYPDPDNLMRVLFHSQEGFFNGPWKNERFDELVVQAARINDQNQRIALYRQADRILVAEEAALLPLAYQRQFSICKPWVEAPSVPPDRLHIKNLILKQRPGTP
jgi:ABC-type oligopeptide transport system substrate-binding subunit/DNA-binding SARP family transcriptional activator